MNNLKLYLGDCREVLKSLPSNSVDLVFTSPPYNMNLRIRNGKYCSRQITKELTTKYEDYDDNLPMEQYYRFNEEVITELLRVSDLVFYNVQFLTGNKQALFKLIAEFTNKLKEFIVWDKINAQPAIGSNVMNSQFEVILVFQNSNPISRAFNTAQFDRGTLANIWQIRRGKKIDKDHGAVFPLELAETVISNFSNKGSVILDPFMGTGTTGLACKKLNRDFIGIEMSEKYMQVSKRRLND